MRSGFIAELTSIAETDRRVLLLTADLGYRVLEPFAERFPDRFLNVGVAEQNMLGMATGLAEAGLIPFVYSISTFVSMRAYEFLRNGPVLHRLPVRVIGIGGGFDYGSNGPSHHALEDIGLLRLQPALRLIVPADVPQARAALQATFDGPDPVYYRLSKDDRGLIPGLDGRFEMEAPIIIHEGTNVLLLALGACAVDALAAVETLAGDGIRPALAVVASLGLLPTVPLRQLLLRFAAVVTVENHYVAGGLGSLVAEAIAEEQMDCRLVRCGIRIMPSGRSGSRDYLNREHGIDCLSIAAAVRRAASLRERSNDPIRFKR